MKKTVFYSWQSDLANATNRGFIETALERATAAIVADDTVEVEPVVDRDTLGVAGSPDIGATIFQKIENADVFVADISIIGRLDNNRAVPNPNVLIELGYAIKSLDYSRVILVFNLAYGSLSDLPFDLRTRRILTYNMPVSIADRSVERKKLTDTLKAAITAAIMNETRPQENAILFYEARNAIENQKPNRIIKLREHLKSFLKQVDAKQPEKFSEGGNVQQLIEGLKTTIQLQGLFAQLCNTIAIIDDREAALEVHKWFANIIERYDLPQGFQGRFHDDDFDYYKFLGHELYVLFIASALKEEKWNILRSVFANWIPVVYYKPLGQAFNATVQDLARFVSSIYYEGEKQHKLSLEASIIKEHFQNQELSSIISFDDFMNGDLFLFMALELRSEKPEQRYLWRPVSTLYMNSTSRIRHFNLKLSENRT